MGPLDGLDQLLGRQAEAHVDLVSGVAQLLESGRSNLFGDEYTGHWGGPFNLLG